MQVQVRKRVHKTWDRPVTASRWTTVAFTMIAGVVSGELLAGQGLGEPAMAAGTRCALSYETFEKVVPHLDAESCPNSSNPDNVFCRISVGGDHAHVFYFSSEGDQCLLKVESFDDEEVELKFKRP